MTKSSKIQELMLKYLSDEQNHSIQEIKNYLNNMNLNDYTKGQFAGSIGTLIKNGSIKKISRGIYSIKSGSENMRECFVVSPIGADDSDIRDKSNKLFKYIIKPVCEICDFKAIRIDQLNDTNSITQAIIEYLEEADLVIADISGHNPNVFYEMGYRTRTKKPIIHLKEKNEKLPFDINTIRTFDYELTDLDSVEEVKERLIKTIESFTFSEDKEVNNNDNEEIENIPSSIIPILYQILDSIAELKSEMKNINTETIGTVIKSMQSSQQQVSADTASQIKLIGNLMQNPDNFIKLIEISKNLPNANN